MKPTHTTQLPKVVSQEACLSARKALLATYSTHARGLDPLLDTYTLLDLTPLGRQEADGIMGWSGTTIATEPGTIV